jgi:hypothetical protein
MRLIIFKIKQIIDGMEKLPEGAEEGLKLQSMKNRHIQIEPGLVKKDLNVYKIMNF